MLITFAFSNLRAHEFDLVKALDDARYPITIFTIDIAKPSPKIPIGKERIYSLLSDIAWELKSNRRYKQSIITHSDILINGEKLSKGVFANVLKSHKDLLMAWAYARVRWINSGAVGLQTSDKATLGLVKVLRSSAPAIEVVRNIGYAERMTLEFETAGTY